MELGCGFYLWLGRDKFFGCRYGFRNIDFYFKVGFDNNYCFLNYWEIWVGIFIFEFYLRFFCFRGFWVICFILVFRKFMGIFYLVLFI